jgi:hypothetical protein
LAPDIAAGLASGPFMAMLNRTAVGMTRQSTLTLAPALPVDARIILGFRLGAVPRTATRGPGMTTQGAVPMASLH